METKKLVIEISGRNVFELSAGGGASQLGPDSVGTEEIKDGTVRMEDLDPTIVTTPEEARSIVAKAIGKTE